MNGINFHFRLAPFFVFLSILACLSPSTAASRGLKDSQTTKKMRIAKFLSIQTNRKQRQHRRRP